MTSPTKAEAKRMGDPSATPEQPSTLYLLAHVFHLIRAKRLEPTLKELDVTPLQYTVLATVGRNAGLSSAQLSRRFQVTAQTMGHLLNVLETRGWLLRTENPENRRLLKHDLTAEGKNLVRQCDRKVNRIETEVLEGLSETQRRGLRESLQKLSQILHEETN